MAGQHSLCCPVWRNEAVVVGKRAMLRFTLAVQNSSKTIGRFYASIKRDDVADVVTAGR